MTQEERTDNLSLNRALIAPGKVLLIFILIYTFVKSKEQMTLAARLAPALTNQPTNLGRLHQQHRLLPLAHWA